MNLGVREMWRSGQRWNVLPAIMQDSLILLLFSAVNGI